MRSQEEANHKLIEMLRAENSKLNERLEFTKFNVKKTLEEWGVDKGRRDELLHRTIQHYQGRLQVFMDEMDDMNKLFHDEIVVKDNIIE